MQKCVNVCKEANSFVGLFAYAYLSSTVIVHLVADPQSRKPGFELPRQQWSLPNCVHTAQGHYSVCRNRWRLADLRLCSCGETQMMSHIVDSCPLAKLDGSVS